MRGRSSRTIWWSVEKRAQLRKMGEKKTNHGKENRNVGKERKWGGRNNGSTGGLPPFLRGSGSGTWGEEGPLRKEARAQEKKKKKEGGGAKRGARDARNAIAERSLK